MVVLFYRDNCLWPTDESLHFARISKLGQHVLRLTFVEIFHPIASASAAGALWWRNTARTSQLATQHSSQFWKWKKMKKHYNYIFQLGRVMANVALYGCGPVHALLRLHVLNRFPKLLEVIVDKAQLTLRWSWLHLAPNCFPSLQGFRNIFLMHRVSFCMKTSSSHGTCRAGGSRSTPYHQLPVFPKTGFQNLLKTPITISLAKLLTQLQSTRCVVYKKPPSYKLLKRVGQHSCPGKVLTRFGLSSVSNKPSILFL